MLQNTSSTTTTAVTASTSSTTRTTTTTGGAASMTTGRTITTTSRAESTTLAITKTATVLMTAMTTTTTTNSTTVATTSTSTATSKPHSSCTKRKRTNEKKINQDRSNTLQHICRNNDEEGGDMGPQPTTSTACDAENRSNKRKLSSCVDPCSANSLITCGIGQQSGENSSTGLKHVHSTSEGSFTPMRQDIPFRYVYNDEGLHICQASTSRNSNAVGQNLIKVEIHDPVSRVGKRKKQRTEQTKIKSEDTTDSD